MEFKIFVVVVILVSVHGIPPPKQIEPTPNKYLCGDGNEIEALNKNCCIMAPFFAKEIVSQCGGAVRMLREPLPFHNTTWFRRTVINCEDWKCILARYHLLGKDNKIEDEKFNKHLDRWVKFYPEFEAAIFNAKIECRLIFHSQLPIDACKVMDYIRCYRSSIKENCPLTLNTPLCIKQRRFYKECKSLLDGIKAQPRKRV